MSYSSILRFTLNIKDINISFNENCVEELKINGKTCLAYKGTLTYTAHHCDSCGVINEGQIIKHGTKLAKITMCNVSNFKTLLFLRKQRFFCKDCLSTFVASTPEVNRYCSISNNVKHQIALTAQKKISIKDISDLTNVSHSTAHRVVATAFDGYQPNRRHLPEVLLFDEFKSTKDAAGAMSFIYMDGHSGQIIDILQSRKQNYLFSYFKKFPKEVRDNVKYVVVDMYQPYMKIINSLFKNAKIIIDKFHIVQHINRALNKLRIKVMYTEKELYRAYKRHWQLILKDQTQLDDITYKKYRGVDKAMTQRQFVELLVGRHNTLKENYDFYQSFLLAINTKNLDLIKYLLKQENISIEMKTVQKTFEKYHDYIINSLNYGYTNGKLEGMNNKIKVIKRIAFGYRSFVNFKSRILIINNLVQTKRASQMECS